MLAYRRNIVIEGSLAVVLLIGIIKHQLTSLIMADILILFIALCQA